MATPCSSAALMTSSSRIEPPGWITAVAPASITTNSPSANGKNASDATTDPLVIGKGSFASSAASCALRAAMRAESTRLIWPAPMPTVARSLAYTMVLDLTCLATRNANLRSRSSAAVGPRLVTVFSVMSSTTALSRLCTSEQQAQVLPLRNDGNGLLGGIGSDDHFGQNFSDDAGRFRIQRAIDGDDAAVWRLRVTGEGLAVSADQIGALGDPAGVGMLDDDAGRGPRRIEFGDAFIGRVSIVDVVVRQLLALQLPRRGDAWAFVRRAIERGLLMRVFAVAQRLNQPPAESAEIRRVGLELTSKPVRDRGVIGGRAGIGLCRQASAQRQRCRALIGGEFVEHGLIILGFDDDSDIVVVLRRGADHRRPANVDVLDALLEAGALIDDRLERIEIDHQKIDRRDAVRLHRVRMFGVAADRQQSAMHFGMKGLDPSVHHFRKSGQFRYIRDLQARGGNRLGGAAGGDEIDAVAGQRAGEFDQSGFIRDGQQSAGHAARMVGHSLSPNHKPAA